MSSTPFNSKDNKVHNLAAYQTNRNEQKTKGWNAEVIPPLHDINNRQIFERRAVLTKFPSWNSWNPLPNLMMIPCIEKPNTKRHPKLWEQQASTKCRHINSKQQQLPLINPHQPYPKYVTMYNLSRASNEWRCVLGYYKPIKGNTRKYTIIL